ncbi:MAG: S1 RNA-binding domain-containing protein [Candidatus Cloacimonetes bacterium]|nr:S1 RNA-binding domain-containing protein [Candidatus Cloacimonadota bacterium]
MTDENLNEEEIIVEESMDDFEELWSESFVPAKVGRTYVGKIVRIDAKDVYLDISFKNEGIAPLVEFSRDTLPPALGQEVEVMVMKNDEDSLILSKSKAEAARAWKIAAEAYETKKVVRAKVHNKVKGGLNADCNGLKAFIPGSLMSLHPEYDLEKYVGKEFDFQIIEFNKRRRNMVLSRKMLLQEERRKNIEHIFETLKEGDICEGIVKNITDYGAFVSIVDGQIDGLLHKADMSWAHVRSVSSVLNLGDKIQVKILSIDRDKEKISLGVKQLSDDPWNNIEKNFEVDSRHQGKVKNITHFGVFVELTEGVEGLVHVSDISWTQRIKHPEELLKIGDEVDVKILSYEKETRKIALGIKQCGEDPWEAVFDKHEEGQVISGCVKNITDFGVFVEIENGIQGLVHISDLSWSNKISHPKQVVDLNQTVTCKIISMNKESRKISLSIKEVSEDPWNDVVAAFPIGTSVKGKVTGLTNFGAFVEIAENVEGMIHISDFAWNKHYDNASDFLTVDTEVECKILEIDPSLRKISLGIKQLTEEPWVRATKNFAVGTVFSGKINNITNFGAFISLEDGIDGLLHVSDISWTEKIDHPSDKFKVEDELKVIVLAIDSTQRKISLGLKQLSDDPVEKYFSTNPLKSIVEVEVKEVLADGSAVLKLNDEVDGIVTAKQMNKDLSAGDTTPAKLVEFNTREMKIHLSVKQAERDLEKSTVAEYNKANDQKVESASPDVNDALAALKAELETEERENV